MASITRTISTTPFAVGTYVQTSNVGAFKVTVIGAGAVTQDLRNENASREVIEMILTATNAIGYTIANANTGIMTLLVDNSQWNAAALQVAIRALSSVQGDDSTATDTSATTVAAATTLTAA
jgi:hypothetical protein